MATEPLFHDSNTPDNERSADSPSSSHVSNDILESTIEHHQLLPLAAPLADTILMDQSGSTITTTTGPSLPIPEDAKLKLLPVSATSVKHTKPSHTSFFIPGSGNSVSGGEPERLPLEIAKADLSIAADGSFVQTTSAPAARELKKCYDRILGVGAGGAQGVVRSPYAITAVQDEYGASVFRISHRIAHDAPTGDLSPSVPSTSYSTSPGSGHRRKARLSMHDFLPAYMFKPNNDSNLPQNTTSMFVGSGSTPPTNTSTGPASYSRRKLRKTRSNSDLQSRVTGANASGDNAGHTSPPPRSEHFSIEIRDEVTAGADPFGQVLGWSSEISTDTRPPARARSSTVPVAEDRRQRDGLSVQKLDNLVARRPAVSTSVALNGATEEACGTPFGDAVRYTAPLVRSALLSQSPQLREMQSFESGLTAKIGDDRDNIRPETPRSESKGSDNEAFLAAKNPARFSTGVFDVLQTYTGLPLPSTFLSAPPTGATIKLSFADSANPKDDPRFVIWGEVQPERTYVDDASVSHSHSSHTDLSTSSPSLASGPGGRKRPPQSLTDAPQVVISAEANPQTVIVAATVERWIAQLTSQFDYDELLNFLLTYRTYIPPVDLCHLLICRFHWTLENSSSVQDDTVRRIVGVRTFIAIRYWLLTFFREDFLPNPELCSLFSSWLNTLFKDPALTKRPDVLNIVRKLKKIARECKAAHSRHRPCFGRPSVDSTLPSDTVEGSAMSGIHGTTLGNQLNEDGSGQKLNVDLDDSDVDLDFTSITCPRCADTLHGDGGKDSFLPSFTPPTLVIPTLQNRSSATPSANTILLSQPLSATILGHVKSSKPGTDTPLTQTLASLPVQHSAISRAFVNTIGRLGRWRRVLNARSSVSSPHCGDMSAFDLELNATGDLLAVRGGVEEYLKMLNFSPPLAHGAEPSGESASSEADSTPAHPPGLTPTVEVSSTEKDDPSSSARSSVQLDVVSEEVEKRDIVSTTSRPIRSSDASFITESEVTEESTQLTSQALPPPRWAPEVVSLDDYDLSDSDSSSHSPTRVRKLPRRLPLRRDFQFVRRSIESVSSMGIRSRSSLASSIKSVAVSVKSHRSSYSNGRPLVTAHVHQWQIELISDDEDEAGDAEAALRRLEGQIDFDRQREKDMKVGRWLKTASRRNHRDSASSTHSGGHFLEVENDEGEEQLPDHEDVTISVDPVQSPTLDATSMSTANSVASPSEVSALLTPATDKTPIRTESERDRSASVHVPVSSRPNSRSTSIVGAQHRPSMLGRAPRNPPTSKFSSSHIPPAHRSFILLHRSETLAQQFAIIEAELFAKVKFEELVSHQWGQSLEDVDVKDWVQFVKDRARLKNTSKVLDSTPSAKLSAILALRARFDLLVNFTSSEILLTHTNERVMVVEKFIRIAWKTYLHNNFSTLVSLMAGLQTRWVNLAMNRQWHKVSMWEQRVFDDLKRFTSRPGEFKYLRNATAALIDARPLHVGKQDGANPSGPISGSSAASRSKNSEIRNVPPYCVPFLGVYLAQLYEYERLPDFIDPTAPSEPVLIDGETGMLSPPSYPEVFFNLQPLPRDLILEPLINVHKQRLIAGVIKRFVAGQHLATNIPFKVDEKCFQKCFRLRSLNSEALHSIAKSFHDS